MNIAGFRCKCFPGRLLPLDHYDKGACPTPPFPLEWIKSILARERADTLHRDDRITATRLLGCPRQSILLDHRPVHLDVRRIHSAHSGSVWHAEMVRHTEPGAYTEVRIPPEGAEPPILFGVPIEGRVDRVRADMGEIVDWKTHGEKSQGFKWRRRQQGRPDRELAVQLNIYRLAIARSVLKVPDEQYRPRLVGWHMAMVAAGRGPGEPEPERRGRYIPEEPPPSAFQVECPIMSEEEIARFRPFDEDEAPGTQPYSVRELVAMYVGFQRDLAAGMAFEMALRKNVPLVGRAVWRGTMCTRYCLALELCDEVEGIKR